MWQSSAEIRNALAVHIEMSFIFLSTLLCALPGAKTKFISHPYFLASTNIAGEEYLHPYTHLGEIKTMKYILSAEK